jgi:hypothetical protein
MGVRGEANKLIKDFLSNRHQLVKYKDALSDSGRIGCGVPQGSLLGPLLFNIFISDMRNLGVDCEAFKYADDASIKFVVMEEHECNEQSNTHRLHLLLNGIVEYYNGNLLRINHAKSFYMVIGRIETEGLKVMLDSAGFNETDSINYLGVDIDKKLHMHEYANSIASRSRHAIGALLHMRGSLPTETLLNFYFGHVHSHLMRCGFLLARCTESELDRLQVIQKRALKIVFRLPLLHSTIDLFTTHAPKVLPVRAMILYSSACLVHKIVHDERPSRVISIVNSSSARLRTLRIHAYRTRVMRDDIAHYGVNSYNELPITIRDAANMSSFKRKLKRHLLEKREDFL